LASSPVYSKRSIRTASGPKRPSPGP